MEILYLLIPLSLMFVFLIGGIFWWSLRGGQFEDLEGPGYKILMDDDRSTVVPRSGEVVIDHTESQKKQMDRPD